MADEIPKLDHHRSEVSAPQRILAVNGESHRDYVWRIYRDLAAHPGVLEAAQAAYKATQSRLGDYDMPPLGWTFLSEETKAHWLAISNLYIVMVEKAIARWAVACGLPTEVAEALRTGAWRGDCPEVVEAEKAKLEATRDRFCKWCNAMKDYEGLAWGKSPNAP